MMRTALLAGIAGLIAGGAVAQDIDIEFEAGKREYAAACAACHGEAADGNGPIAAMFDKPVPDLTGLAARNDGVFPMIDVIHTIDGRAVVRAHGDPMPVFGSRFEADEAKQDVPYPSEAVVRMRVLELALYLQSIQK